MAISQNFPDEGPTLNLNFAGGKVLDPRITFSRTSVGTYMDADGLVSTASTDSPRFDHRYVNGEIESLGLLVEESRENLVDYSESFDSWNSGNVDIGINTTTAPDGTQNADSLIERDLNYTGGAYRRKSVSIGSAYSGKLTFSVFLKSAEVTTVGLIIDIPELSDPRANVNLTSSTTSGSGTNSTYVVESFPNDWKRVSLTTTNSLSSYTGSFLVALYLNGYVGFDNTGNSGDKVFVWGAQLEKGAFPTSYIPTSGSTKTRSPDNVSMTGTNFSDWFNSSEGTLYVRANTDAGVGVRGVAAINRPSNFSNDRVDIRYNQSVNSRGQFNSGTLTRTSGFDFYNPKFILSYEENFRAYGINADITQSTSSFTPSTNVDTLIIGNIDAGTNYYLCGTISQLTYYPTRLSNTLLQNLTK